MVGIGGCYNRSIAPSTVPTFNRVLTVVWLTSKYCTKELMLKSEPTRSGRRAANISIRESSGIRLMSLKSSRIIKSCLCFLHALACLVFCFSKGSGKGPNFKKSLQFCLQFFFLLSDLSNNRKIRSSGKCGEGFDISLRLNG